MDGSVLAAAFGRTITFWDAKDLSLKSSVQLPGVYESAVVHHVQFVGEHFILGMSAGLAVFLWDCRSLQLKWVLKCRAVAVTVDAYFSSNFSVLEQRDASYRISIFDANKCRKLGHTECTVKATAAPALVFQRKSENCADSFVVCRLDDSCLLRVHVPSDDAVPVTGEEGDRVDMHEPAVQEEEQDITVNELSGSKRKRSLGFNQMIHRYAVGAAAE
jgi:hypothetical protein